jgi:hypothetical protein
MIDLCSVSDEPAGERGAAWIGAHDGSGVDLGGWFAILPSLPLPGRGVFIESLRASAARIDIEGGRRAVVLKAVRRRRRLFGNTRRNGLFGTFLRHAG